MEPSESSTEIGQWWPKLTQSTQVWLLENNGSPLTPEVSGDIVAAGGPSGDQLADEDVDWIEAVSNDEDPD
jgi:hypothetical protein